MSKTSTSNDRLTSASGGHEQAGSSASGAPAAADVKSAFRAPAAVPTQEGPDGLRYDFNEGCRLTLPEGDWHVRLRDAVTNNTLFETQIKVIATMRTTVPRPPEVEQAMAQCIHDAIRAAIGASSFDGPWQCGVFREFVPGARYIKSNSYGK